MIEFVGAMVPPNQKFYKVPRRTLMYRIKRWFRRSRK